MILPDSEPSGPRGRADSVYVLRERSRICCWVGVDVVWEKGRERERKIQDQAKGLEQSSWLNTGASS